MPTWHHDKTRRWKHVSLSVVAGARDGARRRLVEPPPSFWGLPILLITQKGPLPHSCPPISTPRPRAADHPPLSLAIAIIAPKSVDADPAPLVATTMSVEAPSSSLETTNKAINAITRTTVDTPPKTIAHRRWQDSNAKLIVDSPPRRHMKARPEKTNADNDHGKTTSNVFRCRQDAFGNLLRSLDLSPHCSS
jgi:hypothetical protein